MSNKNTNPGGGKTAVPADINNAHPRISPNLTTLGRGNVLVARAAANRAAGTRDAK